MNANARRVRARAMELAAHVAMGRYQRRLQGVMGGLHSAVAKGLKPHLHEVARGTQKARVRQDALPTAAWKKKLDNVRANIQQMRKPVAKAFDEMSSTVDKKNREATKVLLGIQPADTGAADVIGAFREENMALITRAAGDYIDDIEDVLSDPQNFGLDVDALADLIEERGEVSASRAALIARDQTLKLNGQLNALRQQNAGVAQYIWSTSKDERVRPTHADLDGTTQSWDDPPETNDKGDTNHPGQDFQCRCVAIPVFDEDEDEDA